MTRIPTTGSSTLPMHPRARQALPSRPHDPAAALSLVLAAGTAALLLGGCASQAEPRHAHKPNVTITARTYDLPKCAAPVPSWMVGRVNCRAARCFNPYGADPRPPGVAALLSLASGTTSANFAGVGDGLGAMLTTALKETGCFDLQEREAMGEIAQELNLAGRKLETQQADYMISASGTEIDFDTRVQRFGGGVIPVIGSIRRRTQRAELGMDVKIVDVDHARGLDAKTFAA